MKFKKFISCLLAFSMLMVPNVFGYDYGDVNRDNQITSSDAAAILQNVLNEDSMPFDSEQKTLSLVSGNATLTATDAAQVLQKVLNSDYSYPIELTSEKPTEETTKEITTETTTKETTTETTTKKSEQTEGGTEVYRLTADNAMSMTQNEPGGDKYFFTYNGKGSTLSSSATVDGQSFSNAFKFSSSNRGAQFNIYGGKATIKVIYSNGAFAVKRGNDAKEDLYKSAKVTEPTMDTFVVDGKGGYTIGSSGNANCVFYLIEVTCESQYGLYPTAPDLQSIKTMERYGEVEKHTQTIVVQNGEVWDGKGVTIDASAFVSGGQEEGGDPIFKLMGNCTVKNVILGDPGGDGIHIYGNNCRVENVHWQDVGEDALTVKQTGDVTVYGCSSMHANDKVFQINASTNITIQEYRCYNIGTFLKQNGGSTFTMTAYLDNVSAEKVKNCFADSSVGTTKCYARNLYIYDCEDMGGMTILDWN